jgi:hypothetical protein
VNPNDFYPYKILPYGQNHIIQIQSGTAVAITLSSFIPFKQHNTLYQHLRRIVVSKDGGKPDSRGTIDAIKLGHYLERGGEGSICKSALHQSKQGKRMVSAHSALWKTVSSAAQMVDPIYYATLIDNIPNNVRTMEAFSLFVGHRKAPKLVHKDCKDWKWCFLFLMGNFGISGIYLYYLNIFIQLQAGDLVILNSNMIWHQADQNIPEHLDRYSGILTTHKGLLKRFVNVKK